jgi:hypothetical protein
MTKPQSTFSFICPNCLTWSQECVGISLIYLDNGATKLPLMLISNTNMRSNIFSIQNTKKTKNKKNVKNK